jgi:hypothetical protein
MNVDIFQSGPGYPSIKWYFFASIPLMILVVILYLFIKSSVSNRRDNPLQRGVYEEIYYQFATDHPQLWSRAGPRTFVVPKGVFSRFKWMMVKRWFDPSKTIARRNLEGAEEMGFWARVKRRVAMRWLGQITLAPGSGDVELGAVGSNGAFSTVTELLQVSAPMTMAEAQPRIAARMGSPPFRRYTPTARGRSRSSSRGRSGDRPASPAASEMVVEEDKSDDDGGSGSGSGSGKDKVLMKDDRGKEESPARAGARRIYSEGRVHGDLLGVPLEVSRANEHAP